jgi:replicative DNA helicase
VQDLDGLLAGARAGRQTYATGGGWAAQLLDDLRNGTSERPVPTGFVDLDRLIGGFRRGEQHIVAARPSMGKTAFCVALMLNAAEAGYPVNLFSLEMNAKTGIMARCMASHLFSSMHDPLPYATILRHLASHDRRVLRDADLCRIEDAADAFQRMPFDIDDQPALTIAEIGSRIRQRAGRMENAKHETTLVIIDHMGKIKPTCRYSGHKTAEVSETSKALADLAKNLNVALVTLCQLNRGTEGQENKRPSLANLRDSGEIEEDADLVLFLYRPSYYLERARENNSGADADRVVTLDACRYDLEVGIAKQRNGPCITVDLWADMANNAIRNKVKR